MNNIMFKTIIFDLDGTLVDTVPDVLLALNHTLLTYHQPIIDVNTLFTLMGKGAKAMIEGAFQKNDFKLSPDVMTNVLACYLDYYQAHPVLETSIYPGVVETLRLFQDLGVKLGICTNKPAVMAHLVLEKLNLKHFFSAIVAGDEVTKPKPSDQHIIAVLKKMNATLTQTLMVGDSEIDKISAENAGIPFIGARYGYAPDQMTSGHIIDHFSELPTLCIKISKQDA